LLILVINKDKGEFGATIAAIPAVLFLLGAAAIALKREIKWLMIICLILFCLSQGYFSMSLVSLCLFDLTTRQSSNLSDITNLQRVLITPLCDPHLQYSVCDHGR
jgi:hypothetical protein